MNDDRNSFQKWADDYARAFGFIVRPFANWVILERDGQPIEVMSVRGVQDLCAAQYRTELTPAGEQAVIPGCERNFSPKAKQLDLFG